MESLTKYAMHQFVIPLATFGAVVGALWYVDTPRAKLTQQTTVGKEELVYRELRAILDLDLLHRGQKSINELVIKELEAVYTLKDTSGGSSLNDISLVPGELEEVVIESQGHRSEVKRNFGQPTDSNLKEFFARFDMRYNDQRARIRKEMEQEYLKAR